MGVYSFNTMHAYVNAFGNFLKYARTDFGVKLAGQVEPHMAEQYLRHCAEKDVAMGTLGKIASVINKADAVMKDIGWRSKDAPPLLAAGAGRHRDAKPTPFTPDEAQAIVELLRQGRDPRFAQLAMVQRYAGLRLREAVNLRVEAVSERGDRIRLASGDGTKNGKPREVAVLSPDGCKFFVKLREAAVAHNDGFVFRDRKTLGRAYERELRRVCRELGIAHSRTHDLCSLWAGETYGCFCLMGASDRQARYEVSTMLGHGRLAVLRHYLVTD
ncbi:MAG: integrase domain-containing protein [Anaerolineales bacterium]|nr:integrase domain-containing protein [Anaerolineales bacterium]